MSTNLHDAIHREREDKHKKENIKCLTAMIEVMEQNMMRLSIYKDPITRSCVFLEKLLIILDFFKGLRLYFEDEEIPDNLLNRADKVYKIINDNVELLIETIQQPCYSPDHPYGKEVMNNAKHEFERLKLSELKIEKKSE